MAFTVTGTLEGLVNRLLRQDQETLAAVKNLSGRVIAIEVPAAGVTLMLEFEASGLRLKPAGTASPDVTIRGGPLSLLGLLLSKDLDEPGPTADLEIAGDVNLAQQFQAVMRNLEIDWEEYLSGWTGDTAARKLGLLFAGARRCGRETVHAIAQDVGEYLKYEQEALPDRSEVEEFVAAVDAIRDDAERCRQRIARLERRIPQKA